MDTIFTFLFFRLKQVFRSIQEVGIPILIVFFIATLGLLFKILLALSEVQDGKIGLLSFLFIAAIHTQRKDEYFLKNLNVSQSLLLLLEYTFILLPVSIVLLFLGKAIPAMYWQLGALPVLLFPIGIFKKKQSISLFSWNKIPSRLFEIKTGLRKYFLILLVMYLLALGCSFFIGTLVLFTLILVLLIPSFFEYFEPKEVIAIKYSNGFFLKNKIMQHVILTQLIMLPHYILFLFFHSQMWYLGLYCLVILLLSVIFSIVYKYASYRPYLPKSNRGAFQTIFLATLVMPGLVLASIAMTIYFWRKATNNLDYFYA